MREKSYIETRKRGKNREREKTRESRKVESRETDPIRRKGKRILWNGGCASGGGTLSHDAADAGATGNGQGVGREREVVGGLRRIPRAVGSDGGSDGGGGVDPCTAI